MQGKREIKKDKTYLIPLRLLPSARAHYIWIIYPQVKVFCFYLFLFCILVFANQFTIFNIRYSQILSILIWLWCFSLINIIVWDQIFEKSISLLLQCNRILNILNFVGQSLRKKKKKKTKNLNAINLCCFSSWINFVHKMLIDRRKKFQVLAHRIACCTIPYLYY